ncbi:MAG: ERMES complex subunit [Cirrosporium novae-zelandiae]|nr:MAG: ERMES complex subunit [Cirrosporium novae-zelandiae]
MAFNFNWSPLTADSSFYTRARELLTGALNKYPKPPIIVDDILVTELNLGSVPPDLEILEIGDLAEDRFRGIFKMCYNGDAYMTLKTRVQLNPLNTYLSGKPNFASPEPLAAASGLTIPIQLTLSNIKLSAFIILVFSRQKGITLVFRNDPLESVKVSSTFDSIPFVRDYLQKTIDKQLRTVFMDELPGIIHRLSLRLWVPEYREQENLMQAREEEKSSQEEGIDPLATPPSDPVDSCGHLLDPTDSFSLEAGSEPHSLFSQRNLLRLAALTDSQSTLSLFTPSIRDAIYRAWAGAAERGDGPGLTTPATPSPPTLSRSQSLSGATSTTYTFSDGATSSPRPALSNASLNSFHPGWHGKPHGGRKRKNRTINLRRLRSTDNVGESEKDTMSVSGDSTFSNATENATSSVEHDVIAEENENENGEVTTPPKSPIDSRFTASNEKGGDEELPTVEIPTIQESEFPSFMQNWERSFQAQEPQSVSVDPSAFPRPHLPEKAQSSYFLSPPRQAHRQHRTASSASTVPPSYTSEPTPNPFLNSSRGGVSITEQAFMMKMASEMARRVAEEKEKARNGNPSSTRTEEGASSVPGGAKARESQWGWGDVMDRMSTPPPAYRS